MRRFLRTRATPRTLVAAWWLAVAWYVLLTMICILFVDRPVASWVGHGADFWNGVVSVVEYATGIEPWIWLVPVILCVLVLWTFQSPLGAQFRRGVLFVALDYLLARNLMMWGKLAFGRLRPHQWIAGESFWRHGESFPSGHVVLVAGLIVPLVVVAPRLRPLLALVLLVAIARVFAGAHWVGDVMGGFACVALSTAICVPLLRRRR
ncbi:MAG TPA: phosphatase PAP2 family protein [Kofleriaceae bacterium]|jgi:membrane-associated phospholipid phosphatase